MYELKFWVDLLVQPFLVAFSLWLIFWKGYWQKKAENIATKEDIGKITKKIKTIETGFDVLKENRIGFQTEKRKSVITFYEKLNNLFNYLEYARYDYESFEVKRNRLDELISAFNFAEARLRLFMKEYTDELRVQVFSISVDLHLVNDEYLSTLIELKEESNSDIEQGKTITYYENVRDGRLKSVSASVNKLVPVLRSMLENEYVKK